MVVKLNATAMCCFCGLHDDVTIECEHESQITVYEFKFRQNCVYCGNKSEHVVTELKGEINAKEKVVFT